MKVWVYVEGESDKLALNELWKHWKERLKAPGHGIEVVPLGDKAGFFRNIGARAAEKLAGTASADVVVGLPDFYPNGPYAAMSAHEISLRHDSLGDLQLVQRALVERALRSFPSFKEGALSGQLSRFYPSALKHDLEMLLLAASDQLRGVLGTKERLAGSWTIPVENQNQARPPKRVVEELFITKSRTRHAYRDTRDAPAVLRAVTDIGAIVRTPHGQKTCPVFDDTITWIGQRVGLAPYPSMPNAALSDRRKKPRGRSRNRKG